MASTWIPYFKDLPKKVEVLQIVELTGLSLAEVVFNLMTFWAWIDDVSEDGKVCPVSVRILSRICPPPSDTNGLTFWEALENVGWMRFDGDSIEVPNIDFWGSPTAKSRLRDARRKARDRQRRQNGADKKRTKGGQKVHRSADYRTEQNNSRDNPLTPLEAVTFPEGFNSAEVKAALAKWASYRKGAKLKALKQVSLQGIVNKWSREGQDEFIRAVEHSIAQGYHGLYPPGQSGKRVGRDRPGRVEPEPGKYDGLM